MTADSALFALILAAGQASRYRDVKQLALFRGQTLVERAVREAEAVCGERSVLVTGHAATRVHAACQPLRGFLVHNDDYASGIASSIRSGVRALAEVAEGILITLADQPLVDRQHLAALCSKWQQHPQRIVASRYADTSGVPAIFPRSCFPELLELQGDQGARSVIDRHGDNRLTIFSDAAAFDVDQPADLDKLEKN